MPMRGWVWRGVRVDGVRVAGVRARPLGAWVSGVRAAGVGVTLMRAGGRVRGAGVLLGLLLGLLGGPLAAQGGGAGAGVPAGADFQGAAGADSRGGAGADSASAALSAALADGQRAHLDRVALWGALNLIAGAALFGASSREEHPTRRAFGLQTAGWGAVNLGIVGWALLAGAPEPATTLSGALAAEDRWAHILLVNLGLNVGYMAVGTALAVAAGRGLDSGPTVKGHGAAVILQGAGLMVLDGLAWAASSGRMGALRGLVEALEGAEVAALQVRPGGYDAAAIEFAVRLPTALFGG